MIANRIKAWAAETDEYYAEVYLIRHEARGEVDLYRRTGPPPTLVRSRELTLEEIAIVVAQREDLMTAFLDTLVREATS